MSDNNVLICGECYDLFKLRFTGMASEAFEGSSFVPGELACEHCDLQMTDTATYTVCLRALNLYLMLNFLVGRRRVRHMLPRHRGNKLSDLQTSKTVSGVGTAHLGAGKQAGSIH